MTTKGRLELGTKLEQSSKGLSSKRGGRAQVGRRGRGFSGFICEGVGEVVLRYVCMQRSTER